MHEIKNEPFILVICEKPHAARRIAQALGTNTFKRSISSEGVPFFMLFQIIITTLLYSLL
jgi:DNA topoisomerase IA